MLPSLGALYDVLSRFHATDGTHKCGGAIGWLALIQEPPSVGVYVGQKCVKPRIGAAYGALLHDVGLILALGLLDKLIGDAVFGFVVVLNFAGLWVMKDDIGRGGFRIIPRRQRLFVKLLG